MEIILERENMARALKQDRANKGFPGVDDMTVDQLPSYWRRHRQKVKAAYLMVHKRRCRCGERKYRNHRAGAEC